MSFWTSGSGAQITGNPQDAFVKEFSIIPNNTTAVAKITDFVLLERENKYTGVSDKFYQITWKIETGEFKNREVTQKIKCFNDSPQKIDKALNMLKLVMDLCSFRPEHANAPDNQDLAKMKNKVCGIKIREWSMPKADGSGISEGNWICEVHPAAQFITETGIKIEHKAIEVPYQSALSRNNKTLNPIDVDDDLPF